MGPLRKECNMFLLSKDEFAAPFCIIFKVAADAVTIPFRSAPALGCIPPNFIVWLRACEFVTVPLNCFYWTVYC